MSKLDEFVATVNENYGNLAPAYLFREIGRRTRQLSTNHPEVAASIIKLGIGDTTRPLPPVVVGAMMDAVQRLGTLEGYSSFGHYGDEQGMAELRNAIALQYSRRGVTIDSEEILVSDGAKSDLGNVQSIFGANNIVAIQDPVYPAYLDVSAINGRSGDFDKDSGRYKKIIYMPCTPENGFNPEDPGVNADLIYLCSPNNPTGAVMNRGRLEKFVENARAAKAVIIFDAAYSAYISDSDLPRSIYEIDGAKRCAIEIQSFSKSCGFTGLRLGWAVVPKELETADSGFGRVHQIWNRRQTTFFNGASNIAQKAGIAALTLEGQAQCQEVVDYYKLNAQIIRVGLIEAGLETFGGENAPYIWARTPNGLSSWDFFDKLLNEVNVVCTPGAGFGPSGEGFFRLSGFGSRESTEEAIGRIKTRLRV